MVLSSDDEDDDATPSNGLCLGGLKTDRKNSLLKATLGSQATKVGVNFESRKTRRYVNRGTKHSGVVPRRTESMLWVDKYAPTSEAELGLHKKKVQEVKSWFEQQVQHGLGVHVGNRVLLLTGPSGAGKTAVVRVLAKQLNFDLFELNTPVPTLYGEHVHNVATGVPYVSKLKDFEEFVLLSMKYPSLALVQSSLVNKNFPAVEEGKHENTSVEYPLSSTVARDNVKQGFFPARESETRDPVKLLLIEDLPMVGDLERKQQLADLMFRLASFTRFPTVIIISGAVEREGSRDRSGDGIQYVLKALERGGVKKIEFNPIAPGLLKKALMRVATAEKLNLPQETLKALTDQSAGDIRHAISSLQFFCLGNIPKLLIEEKPPWDPGGEAVSSNLKRRKSKQQAKETGQLIYSGFDSSHEGRMVPSVVLPGFSADDMLDLYHVLGKILYNKRLDNSFSQHGSSFSQTILEELQRPPLDMEEPELILAHARITTSTLSSFLYENVLDFVHDDAIEDAAKAQAYLSDCDLLQGLSGKLLLPSGNAVDDHTEVETSRIAVAAASSVASRGFLFSLTHQAPRRFRQFRRPYLWQIERGQRLKIVEMSSLVCTQNDLRLTGGLTHWSTLATELAPFHETIKHFSVNNTATLITAATNGALQARVEHRFEGQPSCSQSIEGDMLINYSDGSFKSDDHCEVDEIED